MSFNWYIHICCVQCCNYFRAISDTRKTTIQFHGRPDQFKLQVVIFVWYIYRQLTTVFYSRLGLIPGSYFEDLFMNAPKDSIYHKVVQNSLLDDKSYPHSIVEVLERLLTNPHEAAYLNYEVVQQHKEYHCKVRFYRNGPSLIKRLILCCVDNNSMESLQWLAAGNGAAEKLRVLSIFSRQHF